MPKTQDKNSSAIKDSKIASHASGNPCGATGHPGTSITPRDLLEAIKDLKSEMKGDNDNLSKVIAKLRKAKPSVVFLQETHLSKKEHEKFKKLGYVNSFHSSCKNSRRRGVITLLPNSVNFELIKEETDGEGRYVMVKGRIDGVLVSLINIYAPLESDRTFLKFIFEVFFL